MLTNIPKSLLAHARINTFICFYVYLQKPKAVRQFKGFLKTEMKETHI